MLIKYFRGNGLMSEIEEAKSIVLESGNSFHCKVVGFLKKKGWHTQISPYYMDGSTNKPREIDLIAEKSWNYKDNFSGVSGTVNIKLFIECKYIPQVNVFWFSPKDRACAKAWIKNNTCLVGSETHGHHYLSTNENVANLFASKSKQSTENEVIYKALNQSLNAMVYLRHRDSIIPDGFSNGKPILQTIEMPLIICNSFDKFFRVSVEGSADPEPIEDAFQLEVNYAYANSNGRHVNEYFLIDIVDFIKIDKFLAVLDSDKDAVADSIDNRP